MSAFFYYTWFGLFAAVCAGLYYKTQSGSGSLNDNVAFKGFQRLFLGVYLTMMMADWLQGPYVYALYDQYGFTKGQIGQLFIVGFGSSMVFGTVVGGLADKYGRKANCMLFCILYGISCMTKHFNDFNILLLGRLLGGVATSILFSAFEAWMISEHKERNWPVDWLGSTFSAMSFGSGMVAIVAGLLATWLADRFGYVAPFDASLLLLIGGGIVILMHWRENYGESTAAAAASAATGNKSLASKFDNFTKAWTVIARDERVLLLGLIQSCFESAMYIFVFQWTPALEGSLKATAAANNASENKEEPFSLPHGLVFATFMVCFMLGSKAFELLTANSSAAAGFKPRSVEHLARWLFVVSSAALVVPVLTDNHSIQLFAFCMFEVCCGMYFPSAGTMRSRYIPEEIRSTIMNIFRMGLNLIVVLTLFNIDALSQDAVFMFTALLLTMAVLCQHRLYVITSGGAASSSTSSSSSSSSSSVEDANSSNNTADKSAGVVEDADDAQTKTHAAVRRGGAATVVVSGPSADDAE